MPICYTLTGFQISHTDNLAQVTVKAVLDPGTLRLENLVTGAFPGAQIAIEEPTLNLWDFDAPFTFTLRLTGKVPRVADLERLLALLKDHITVVDRLDETHCLDFHQLPTEIPQEFKYTATGRKVYLAKYEGDNDAANQLVDALAQFILRHPRYSRADRIANIPGSISRGWRNLAELLASNLCIKLSKKRATVLRNQPVTSQKNESDETERYSRQQGTMRCDDRLANEKVVLIDDMYGSGGSMQEAARALKAAGAAEVLGLAATKTLKYTRGVSL